jgi:hypothetical protein
MSEEWKQTCYRLRWKDGRLPADKQLTLELSFRYLCPLTLQGVPAASAAVAMLLVVTSHLDCVVCSTGRPRLAKEAYLAHNSVSVG